MSKGVTYMVISALAFSLMQLCVKYLSHIPVNEIVLFRSIVSLILSLIILRRAKVHPLGNSRKFLILRGVFGVTALSLFIYTLQHLPISTAITIQYLSPIFTSIFAIWILKEKMKIPQWVYFFVSFLGIVIIKGFDQGVELKYLLEGLVSAIFSGLAYNMVRKVKDTDHPVVVVFYFPLIAAPVSALLCLEYWVTPSGMDWLLLLLMGTFTQIAQVYMTKGWHSDKANKIASLKYIGILFALSFDFVLFGIVPQWMNFVGIALVLAGVILNLVRPFKKA